MDLAVTNTAPLKPEIRLAQALKEFDALLTDHERQKLHAEGKPDAAAAINLATVIDQECSSQRRQCLGPRLMTCLESIQKFTTVADTFVSSHPEFAALVWGGVKLALLVMARWRVTSKLIVLVRKQSFFLLRKAIGVADEAGQNCTPFQRIWTFISFFNQATESFVRLSRCCHSPL